MVMIEEFLERVEAYLDGRCALPSLESWVLANLQRALDSGDERVAAMASNLDADLIELGEGLIDEVTIRERLNATVMLRETIPLIVSDTEPQATSHASSAADTWTSRYVVTGSVEDYSLDHVFA